MKLRSMAFFFLIASGSYAQMQPESVPALDFRPTVLPHFFSFSGKPAGASLVLGAKNRTSVLSGPIVEGKPYEAFFCKMEVRTESFLGFGFRIHAGDYDNDIKRFVP